MLFHELFVTEVNLFYEETLNKVGGKHPSEASKVQCWVLVTKLMWTISNAMHDTQSFAREARELNMDPLYTNGYFLYAALEELHVLKEFSKVKWKKHKKFGHNMLGFVFGNSVSKAVLDSCPNLIFKANGLDDQLKVICATMDHMQTNLTQIWTHRNTPAMKPLTKKAKTGVAEID